MITYQGRNNELVKPGTDNLLDLGSSQLIPARGLNFPIKLETNFWLLEHASSHLGISGFTQYSEITHSISFSCCES